MTITLQDLRESLKGQRKSEEAIFWFCYTWNSGVDSDLYRAMIETDFHPDLQRQKSIEYDDEICYCLHVLETKFGPFVEMAMRPVQFADVKENDVLTPAPITSPKFRERYGDKFSCISDGWPCRVYRGHGVLGVTCSASHGSEPKFHPLEPDENGYVVGFRR